MILRNLPEFCVLILLSQRYNFIFFHYARGFYEAFLPRNEAIMKIFLIRHFLRQDKGLQ